MRVAARVVVQHESKLLAIHMRDARGDFYILPGGGQHHGESLAEAARREALEETGLNIRIGALLYVRDYIGARHDNPAHRRFHQVEVVFAGELEGELNGQAQAQSPDTRQVAVRWLDAAALAQVRFFPEAIQGRCRLGQPLDYAGYLGCVN